jgi:hypothetical protein
MLEKETITLRETRKTYFPSKDGERSSKIGSNKSKMKCFFCKKPGHHIKDCKARIAKDSRKIKKANKCCYQFNKLYVVALFIKKCKDFTWCMLILKQHNTCHMMLTMHSPTIKHVKKAKWSI